jgi:nitrogen regulatory protein PII-like uncharacterized protein
LTILAISGDIGGQKALVPVLEKMHEENVDFTVIENRGLEKFSDKWKSIKLDSEDEESWNKTFTELNAGAIIFSTSVKDTFPLRLAKKGKEKGMTTFCLLDNWMNYRKRLELDGNLFLPDKYLLMDQMAYNEALKDNLPESILEITGQPALTDIQKSYELFTDEFKAEKKKELGINPDKKLLVFISEPAEYDQGKDDSIPSFRGYTEKTVLKSLSEALQNYSNEIQVAIVPHPREDAEALLSLWKEISGNIEGGFFNFQNGREAIMLADGVAGMASILLHESWFINTPTISLQPDARRDDLLILKDRNGVFCLTDDSEWDQKIETWMQQILNDENRELREELTFHKSAADNIINLIKMELV